MAAWLSDSSDDDEVPVQAAPVPAKEPQGAANAASNAQPQVAEGQAPAPAQAPVPVAWTPPKPSEPAPRPGGRIAAGTKPREYPTLGAALEQPVKRKGPAARPQTAHGRTQSHTAIRDAGSEAPSPPMPEAGARMPQDRLPSRRGGRPAQPARGQSRPQTARPSAGASQRRPRGTVGVGRVSRVGAEFGFISRPAPAPSAEGGTAPPPADLFFHNSVVEAVADAPALAVGDEVEFEASSANPRGRERAERVRRLRSVDELVGDAPLDRGIVRRVPRGQAVGDIEAVVTTTRVTFTADDVAPGANGRAPRLVPGACVEFRVMQEPRARSSSAARVTLLPQGSVRLSTPLPGRFVGVVRAVETAPAPRAQGRKPRGPNSALTTGTVELLHPEPGSDAVPEGVALPTTLRLEGSALQPPSLAPLLRAGDVVDCTVSQRARDGALTLHTASLRTPRSVGQAAPRALGSVMRLKEAFGFISPHSGSGDLFFHFSAVLPDPATAGDASSDAAAGQKGQEQGTPAVTEGDVVTFEPGNAKDGRPLADRVRRVAPTGEECPAWALPHPPVARHVLGRVLAAPKKGHGRGKGPAALTVVVCTAATAADAIAAGAGAEPAAPWAAAVEPADAAAAANGAQPAAAQAEAEAVSETADEAEVFAATLQSEVQRATRALPPGAGKAYGPGHVALKAPLPACLARGAGPWPRRGPHVRVGDLVLCTVALSRRRGRLEVEDVRCLAPSPRAKPEARWRLPDPLVAEVVERASAKRPAVARLCEDIDLRARDLVPAETEGSPAAGDGGDDGAAAAEGMAAAGDDSGAGAGAGAGVDASALLDTLSALPDAGSEDAAAAWRGAATRVVRALTEQARAVPPSALAPLVLAKQPGAAAPEHVRFRRKAPLSLPQEACPAGGEPLGPGDVVHVSCAVKGAAEVLDAVSVSVLKRASGNDRRQGDILWMPRGQRSGRILVHAGPGAPAVSVGGIANPYAAASDAGAAAAPGDAECSEELRAAFFESDIAPSATGLDQGSAVRFVLTGAMPGIQARAVLVENDLAPPPPKPTHVKRQRQRQRDQVMPLTFAKGPDGTTGFRRPRSFDTGAGAPAGGAQPTTQGPDEAVLPARAAGDTRDAAARTDGPSQGRGGRAGGRGGSDRSRGSGDGRGRGRGHGRGRGRGRGRGGEQQQTGPAAATSAPSGTVTLNRISLRRG